MLDASSDERWHLTLDKYQRDNLLWLLNVCGYPSAMDGSVSASAVEPFVFANTGDWLGEVALMLAKPNQGPVLDPGDKPNVSVEELRRRVEAWRESR